MVNGPGQAGAGEELESVEKEKTAALRRLAKVNENSRFEKILTQTIYNALRKANPDALISGDPVALSRASNVLIDGTFNFKIVGRFMRLELERLNLPSS